MDNVNESRFKLFIGEMLHPVRSRLYREVYLRKEATAGELAQALNDVPQASLYRHLNGMVENGVLKVVAQRKKRALYEKVYAVAIDLNEDLSELLRSNRGDVYAALFYQYMMVLFSEFQSYAIRPGIDIVKDGSGFSLSPICVTREELDELMMKIGALLETYRVKAIKPDSGRQLHTVGLIITPPKEAE